MTISLSPRVQLRTDPVDRTRADELLRALQANTQEVSFDARTTRTVAVPASLARIIASVLKAVAEGGTVTVSSMPDELTTTVAAEHMGVSRPTLMKMIRNGEIEARKVGSHHRLKAADVLIAKQAMVKKQLETFHELLELEDELDIKN